MKLSDLDGQLYARGEGTSLRPVDSVPAAAAVMFLCPGCRARLGTDVGCHSILVWFADRDVPPGNEPLPRWKASGAGVADLTLSPSVLIHADPVQHRQPAACPGWHGFVRNGEIVNA